MATVREVIADMALYTNLHIIEGNPYFPEDSDRAKDIVLIPMTGGNALTGAEAICEANHRHLADTWEFEDAFTVYGGGFSQLIGLFLDEEAPEDLEDVIKALEDYPVLCESTLYDVEDEWMTQAWSDYGRNDVRRHLEDDYDDEVIDKAYDYWCRNSDYGAYLEGDSLVFDAEAVAETVVIMQAVA